MNSSNFLCLICTVTFSQIIFPEILRLKKCDQYLCLEFFFNNTIFVMEKLDLLDQYRISVVLKFIVTIPSCCQ